MQITDYQKLYQQYVARYFDSFIQVRIDSDYINRINEYVKNSPLIKRKQEEIHHQIDHNHEYKRHVTGLLGEAAIEKLFDIKIIDWSIGSSKDYNQPDIPDYNLGVKTSEKWNFPVVFKENKYPQIICIRNVDSEHPDDNDVIFVCGLATAEVLNKYQSESLIKSPSLRARHVKAGFYGFSELIKVSNLKDIAPYLKHKGDAPS